MAPVTVSQEELADALKESNKAIIAVMMEQFQIINDKLVTSDMVAHQLLPIQQQLDPHKTEGIGDVVTMQASIDAIIEQIQPLQTSIASLTNVRG